MIVHPGSFRNILLLSHCMYFKCISIFKFALITNNIPHSLCPARWNHHQTRETTKRGGEGSVCDPQQEEGAGLPPWPYRREVLGGSPRHPGERQLLTAPVLLEAKNTEPSRARNGPMQAVDRWSNSLILTVCQITCYPWSKSVFWGWSLWWLTLYDYSFTAGTYSFFHVLNIYRSFKVGSFPLK